MSAPSPLPHRPAFHIADWRPSWRSLLWVPLAFVAGLLLFALVVSGGHEDRDSTTLALPTANGPGYAPLPTPLPAARDDASGLGKTPAADGSEEKPRLVETAPPPRPAERVASTPRPTATATIATSDPRPIPGQTPAPRYPTQALRRGESGTVSVRAEIGADGIPQEVSVASSSGSRVLDRAAMDAVRRWHFTPAMREGEAAPGSVVVPISFDASR